MQAGVAEGLGVRRGKADHGDSLMAEHVVDGAQEVTVVIDDDTTNECARSAMSHRIARHERGQMLGGPRRRR
jgi:hypothetical protein